MKSFRAFVAEAFTPLRQPKYSAGASAGVGSESGNVQLFHKDIGIPPVLAKPTPGMPLKYGYHAADRMAEKGIHNAPKALPSAFTIIETESTGGRATKWVVRFPYDKTDDVVMALLPDGFVKTAWLNSNTDLHKTLKRHLYADPRSLRTH